MRTSVAVASLAIVALAILVPSISARCPHAVAALPVQSYSASVKNAATASDAKTAEANKENEAYTDGNIKYAKGAAKTVIIQDKDSAKSSSVKAASLDADTKTSSSNGKVAKPCGCA